MQKWPLLLLLLTLIAGAFANVGVGPAQLDLEFDSATGSQTVTLYAINLGETQTKIRVSAEGGLSSFVTFENTNFLLAAGETKPFKATIDLPNDYAKGSYELYINVAEVPEEENGTGFAVQSLSSTIVNVNKVSGMAILQQPQNQTAQTTSTNQNQTTETNPNPGGFMVLPPKKQSSFEKFTGGFAKFFSPISAKLSRLTSAQWVIVLLVLITVALLFAYFKEPNKPQQPQLFAYQPQQRYQYPYGQYPQQPSYGYRR